MYDYGSAKENFEHYNQTTAPLYSLNNIKIPVAIYWVSDFSESVFSELKSFLFSNQIN
jgi:hypothetical protein